MQLIIAKNRFTMSGQSCNSSQEAKRFLNENHISKMLIAYQLADRKTGLDILQWAATRNKLPEQITVIEHNYRACKVMGDYLKNIGYRAFDDRQFIKAG